MQPSDHDRALANLLAQQGYYEIATPAELYIPGTINTIEVRSDGKVELHPTCKMDVGMLAKMTIKSRTIDRDLALGLNKKFDISGEMQDLVSATINNNRSAKLNVSLRNSHILLATDEDLLRVQHELVKDTCQEAIELNIKNGGIVCQTRAALKGDLVYDVNYKQELATEETTYDGFGGDPKSICRSGSRGPNAGKWVDLWYQADACRDHFERTKQHARPLSVTRT